MREPCIVGIDPSSKKLAVTIFMPASNDIRSFFYPLRKKANDTYTPKVAHSAYSTVELMVHKHHLRRYDTKVFMEAPVIGRGGAKSTMVQAYVSGAVQAALLSLSIPVTLVNVQVWKKDVVGNGAAGKPQVATAVQQRLSGLKLTAHWQEINADQDIIDATALMMYGLRVSDRAEQLKTQASQGLFQGGEAP